MIKYKQTNCNSECQCISLITFWICVNTITTVVSLHDEKKNSQNERGNNFLTIIEVVVSILRKLLRGYKTYMSDITYNFPSPSFCFRRSQTISVSSLHVVVIEVLKGSCNLALIKVVYSFSVMKLSLQNRYREAHS